jgi:hypothetical protein
MGYSLAITIPGDLAYAPLAIRAVRDLENLPEGPGEEVTTLIPALESLLATVLGSLSRNTPPADLRMHLETGETLLSILLELCPANGENEPAAPLGDRQEELLEQLEASFDDVERPQAGAAFRLALTRRFST